MTLEEARRVVTDWWAREIVRRRRVRDRPSDEVLDAIRVLMSQPFADGGV